MIDEHKSAQLRAIVANGIFSADCACDAFPHNEVLDTLDKLWKLEACLEMTRGQWIHSVNANECLEALAALRENR